MISQGNNKYRLEIHQSPEILFNELKLNRTVCSVSLIVYPGGLQTFKTNVKIKTMTR